jgi:NitT/TauT family transport system substrate-binding protein
MKQDLRSGTQLSEMIMHPEPSSSAFRRALLCLLLVLSLCTNAEAQPRDKISAGALRFSSSGPLFLAKERGYFEDENLDVDIVFFEAAPTIATAVASGDLTFGVTALTGALFNLAAHGQIKLIAGQAREEKGYPGNMILVTRAEFDAGVKRVEQLFNKPFGLTQIGSPSHYQLGQLAQLHGVPLRSIPVQPFQTLPNLVAALKANKVTWAIIAPPIATNLLEAGDVVRLANYSDFGTFQFGGVFATASTLQHRSDAVRRFLRAYKRGLQDYNLLNATNAKSDPSWEAKVKETAITIAKYIYPNENPDTMRKKVHESAFYVDPDGHIDTHEVAEQIRWYFENGFIAQELDATKIIRLEFLD